MEKKRGYLAEDGLNGATLLAAPADSLPGADVLEKCLKQILASRTFQNTPSLRNLLVYLWKNRDAQISEYAIATEALGRSSHFDPKTDATVRVQISRLRQRLEKFYEENGEHCRERLIIPLGSHQIRVDVSEVPSTPDARDLQESVAIAPVPGTGRRQTIYVLAGIVALLAIICLAQTILLRRARQLPKQAAAGDAAWFWKAFFANKRQTRIVLPTPTFFSFAPPGRPSGGSIMFRDTEVNTFAGREDSPAYRKLARDMGSRPSLADNYTVTSDTFACIRLARYLDGFGWQTAVTSMADAPLEALDKENMIAVGTWGTLTPLRPYLDQMSFELGAHETFVKLRNPAPSEPKRIDTVPESPDRAVWPGVIALLPGNGGRTNLLILVSRHTSALVSFLTSTNGLDQLEHLWKAKGSPAYFEVVVNAELNGRGLVRFWPVLLHPYKNKT